MSKTTYLFYTGLFTLAVVVGAIWYGKRYTETCGKCTPATQTDTGKIACATQPESTPAPQTDTGKIACATQADTGRIARATQADTGRIACATQPPLPVLNPVRDTTLAEFRKNLPNPGRDFSSGPLWVWNDRLTEEQIRSTIRDLAGQRVKQVWVHPRPGLMTPYLSPEWFALWKAALDEAQKLDMNVWIYDENSYPSGFAGGLVPDAMPESRGMSLVFKQVASLETITDDIWYIFNPDDKDITADAKKAGKLEPLDGDKKYLLARSSYAPVSGWYGGKWHVDLLKKGVTEKFLDITLDAYNNVPEIQKEFGKRVPGIFTDEPHPMQLHFRGLGTSIAWNSEFAGEFEKRFGYSLVENIPSLVKEVGDWKRIRHNYHQFVLDLFIDRWVKPYSERAEKYKLQLTGHYWEHGWPGSNYGPDNMAMYAWMQRPAIDLLMNTYDGDSAGAQFGNVRSGKELASAANQMGLSRTLSESYGAGGWDLRFEDMKRLGDWSCAVGVNTTNEHLSYVTIRGARKRDHPQSFSYHSPWFEGYHVVADHLTRLSYALSQGRQINKILVIEPTTAAWIYQGKKELGVIAKSFTELVNTFERNQVEYDLGSERIIADWGKVADKQFVVNHASYDLVVIPPNCENLNKKTVELLQQYAKNGGKVLLIGEKPSRVDGAVADIVLEMQQVTLADALAITKKRTEETGLSITVPEGTKTVFHHRRILADAEVLFICNADLTNPVEAKIKTKKHIAIIGDNGKARNSIKVPENGSIGFTLPPAGNTLVLLTNEPITDSEETDFFGENKKIAGSPVVIKQPVENVLVLDYVDVNVGGKVQKNVFTWQANRLVFQAHGYKNGNPWDNEVQFKDELIKKKFPEDSGFEAEYHFVVRGEAPKNASFVIERADLYKITVNDIEIQAAPGAWWGDRAFGKLDISKAIKTGRNTVKIKAGPMLIEHEIEPAYLLGDFSLESAKKGFVVVPTKPLAPLGSDGAAPLASKHSNQQENVAWLSTGVGHSPGKDDRAPAVNFALDGEKLVSGVRVWNYCEANLATRGVNEVEITGLGKVNLSVGDGTSVDLLFKEPQKLSAVSFKILSNHAGTTYPVAPDSKPADHGFVGLAEVQILGADGKPLENVTATASSELVNATHNRKAAFLVDGSGLGKPDAVPQGWDKQGMPFYSGAVAYTRTFENVEKTGRFYVQLPPSGSGWYGATARVSVNGKVAGFVLSAPWLISIPDDLVKAGTNEVTVEIYGTPKNLYGPHHNGRTRGTAWPGMFKRAPKVQPAGNAYDTISYGLYAPFELWQVATGDNAAPKK